MLYQIFTQILNMGITASVVIAVVILIRAVMHRMPKKYLYMLWVIVGIRLICPVAVSSPVSLFNMIGQGAKTDWDFSMDFQGGNTDTGSISSSEKSDTGLHHHTTLIQPQLKRDNSLADDRNAIGGLTVPEACIYWFHPLVWLSYFLMARDMEMSCDEYVLQNAPSDIRIRYSKSLHGFAVNQREIAAGFLAFGETNTRKRVKNVLHFKKHGRRI